MKKYSFYWFRGLLGIITAVAAYLAIRDVSNLSYVVFILVGVEFFLFLRISDERLGDTEILERRMRGYAELKGNPHSDAEGNKNCDAADAFEVLLGILKKVEMKAAALLTVWAIILAAAITVVTSIFKCQGEALPLCILAFSAPILALIRVFFQVDDQNLRCAYRSVSDDSKCLRADLMKDAVLKEMYFRFAYEVTLSFAVLLVIISAACLLLL